MMRELVVNLAKEISVEVSLPIPRCEAITYAFYTKEERPLVQDELQRAEGVLAQVIQVPLLSHQRDALLCLVSDLLGGYASSLSTNFEDSALVKLLNSGTYQLAAAEFFKFCYVCGKIDKRVWRKRNVEQLLFVRGTLNLPLTNGG